VVAGSREYEHDLPDTVLYKLMLDDDLPIYTLYVIASPSGSLQLHERVPLTDRSFDATDGLGLEGTEGGLLEAASVSNVYILPFDEPPEF
jgi:hypothetical protein